MSENIYREEEQKKTKNKSTKTLARTEGKSFNCYCVDLSSAVTSEL